jgi:hypothetical protein
MAIPLQHHTQVSITREVIDMNKLLIDVLKHIREKREIMEACLEYNEQVVDEFLQVVRILRNREKLAKQIEVKGG